MDFYNAEMAFPLSWNFKKKRLLGKCHSLKCTVNTMQIDCDDIDQESRELITLKTPLVFRHPHMAAYKGLPRKETLYQAYW